MKLKETFMNGRVDLVNSTQNTSNTKIHTMNNNNNPNQNQFIDMKQIKRIEPKRPDINSTKGNLKAHPSEYVKIDNLNAKTAEIMKASPSVLNNLNHQNKPLMNVNINNSNKNVKEDISNYEKALFNRQNMNSMSNMNVNMQQNNSNYNDVNVYSILIIDGCISSEEKL